MVEDFESKLVNIAIHKEFKDAWVRRGDYKRFFPPYKSNFLDEIVGLRNVSDCKGWMTLVPHFSIPL